MADSTPTPDPTTEDPTTVQWLPVTHRLTRRHDASVISAHCCSSCGLQALAGGPPPPKPAHPGASKASATASPV